MGIELARAFVTVRADATGLGSDFDRVKSDVESRLLAIQTGAAAILGATVFKLNQLISQGIDQAGFFEKTEAQMGVVLQSAEKAKKLVGELVAFGAKTPFQIPELMMYAQQLSSVGVSTERVIPTLKMLGDAAMGDREKFGRLLYVFKEVQSKGRLLGNDFMQISSTGALSAKFLAEAFKITEQQAAAKMRNLSKEELTRYFEIMTKDGGRFANMMSVMSGTLEGLRSNFQDTTIYIKKFIGEPLLPYVKSLYAGATELTMGLANLLKQGGELSSFAIVGAAAYGGLRAALYGAGLAARYFGIQLRFAMFFSAGLLAGKILAVGAAIGALVSYFQIPKKLGDLFSYLKEKIFENKAVISNFRIAWERIKDTARIVFNAIGQMLNPFLGIFKWSWERMWMDFDKTISKLIVRFSEWALDSAEWIQAIATHWKTMFGLLPSLAGVAFSMAVDFASNAANMMLDSFKNAFGGIVDLIHRMIAEFEIFRESERMFMMGLGHMDVAAANAMRAEAQKMSEQAKKGMGLAPSGVKEIFQISPKTQKMFEDTLGKWIGDIFKTKEGLEKNRRFPKSAEAGGGGGDSKQTPPVSLLKPGVFQIPELGKKFQDAMLKPGGGMEQNVAKLVGIGEAGNAIQNKQLEVLNKLNPGLA